MNPIVVDGMTLTARDFIRIVADFLDMGGQLYLNTIVNCKKLECGSCPLHKAKSFVNAHGPKCKMFAVSWIVSQDQKIQEVLTDIGYKVFADEP